jgi:hypothetical protein
MLLEKVSIHTEILFVHCYKFFLLLLVIETKEFARIGYNMFLFPHAYSSDGLGA